MPFKTIDELVAPRSPILPPSSVTPSASTRGILASMANGLTVKIWNSCKCALIPRTKPPTSELPYPSCTRTFDNACNASFTVSSTPTTPNPILFRGFSLFLPGGYCFSPLASPSLLPLLRPSTVVEGFAIEEVSIFTPLVSSSLPFPLSRGGLCCGLDDSPVPLLLVLSNRVDNSVSPVPSSADFKASSRNSREAWLPFPAAVPCRQCTPKTQRVFIGVSRMVYTTGGGGDFCLFSRSSKSENWFVVARKKTLRTKGIKASVE